MRTFPCRRTSRAGSCVARDERAARPAPRPQGRHIRGGAGIKPAPPLGSIFYTADAPAVRLSTGHGLAHVGGHARRGAAPRAPAAAARAAARAIGMAVAHATAPQTAHCPCGPCNHDQQDRHSRQVEFQTQDHGPSPFLSCTPMPAREKCFPWIILRTTAGRHPKAASRLKQLTSSQNRHRWFSGPIPVLQDGRGATSPASPHAWAWGGRSGTAWRLR